MFGGFRGASQGGKRDFRPTPMTQTTRASKQEYDGQLKNPFSS